MTEAAPRGAEVVYRHCPAVTNAELNALFALAWPQHTWRDFQPVLRRSLAYIGAYTTDRTVDRLIGFINLAWDGGLHAFVLDTTVHPALRRRGIGRQLVRQAVAAARAHGVEWVHVDFEAPLRGFYRQCGFRPTAAGLLQVRPSSHP